MDAPQSVAAASGANLEPRYRPISDYGIIGDCRTAALVGPDGSIDWCCMPHFDSPAVLLRLLDADKGGFFRVRPDSAATTRMEYLPGTNILETTFATDEGRLRLVDFMPIRPRKEQASQVDELRLALSLTPHARLAEIERQLGNDVAAAHRINRMVTCLAGNVTVELMLKATFDYARATPTIERHVINQRTAGAILSAGERFLVLLVRREQTVATPPDSPRLVLDGDDEIVRLRVPLQAGQTIAAVMNYARSAAEARTILAELVGHAFNRDLDETLAYWRDWSASCRYHGPYQEAVGRSALALKL
ncbi:MAG TPA: trehalase-like domain-containing protein, partial [Ktedonobacterales bacterium]|nr:trehalase-like domain-containing protein [Ktedonobacterales bacterium]